MSGLFYQNSVRVLAGTSGYEVVGTGVLVSTPQYGPCILTAGHVVNAALGNDLYSTVSPGSDELVAFDIPVKGVGPERTYACRAVEWSRPVRASERMDTPEGDIALLQVVQEGDGARKLPGDLAFRSVEDFVAPSNEELLHHALNCFGFARVDGGVVSGRIGGVSVAGWFELQGSGTGSFIAPGFSGAAVFDETWRRIFGMVIALGGSDGTRTAYLQSTQNIWKACPSLARPYRGLLAFQDKDATFFFGREAFISEMARKANRHALLEVTAASGSGKSSAVRAGLLPRLKDRGDCIVVTMRPASDPWKALAGGLVEASGGKLDLLKAVDETEDRAKHLRADGIERLRGYAQALLAKRHAERLVIFVDQFEELFTLAGHERADAEADGGVSGQPDFRDLMAGTATLAGEPHVQWLYALRGDFADRAFKHRTFRDAVGDGNVFLGDMTEAELRDAVEQPAAKLNVRFEGPTADQPGLAKRIVAAAGRTQTGAGGGRTEAALPLVQHVLAELWKGMRHRVLTHEAYKQLGKLEGALDRHAEAVFAQLTKDEQGLARRLFSRLLNVEENGEVTRRLASRDDLGEELWPLALRLAGEGNRLLTLRGAASPSPSPEQENVTIAGSATAEVAHEALLRHWQRLQEWVREDQQFYTWRRRFEGQMRDNPYSARMGVPVCRW